MFFTDECDHSEYSGDGKCGSGGYTVPRDPEGNPAEHHHHGRRQVQLQDEVGQLPSQHEVHTQVTELTYGQEHK